MQLPLFHFVITDRKSASELPLRPSKFAYKLPCPWMATHPRYGGSGFPGALRLTARRQWSRAPRTRRYACLRVYRAGLAGDLASARYRSAVRRVGDADDSTVTSAAGRHHSAAPLTVGTASSAGVIGVRRHRCPPAVRAWSLGAEGVSALLFVNSL